MSQSSETENLKSNPYVCASQPHYFLTLKTNCFIHFTTPTERNKTEIGKACFITNKKTKSWPTNLSSSRRKKRKEQEGPWSSRSWSTREETPADPVLQEMKQKTKKQLTRASWWTKTMTLKLWCASGVCVLLLFLVFPAACLSFSPSFFLFSSFFLPFLPLFCHASPFFLFSSFLVFHALSFFLFCLCLPFFPSVSPPLGQ